MKSILIITHCTSNTGAPKICLSVINFFRNYYPQYNIDVLSLDSGGTLEPKFIELSDNYYPIDKLSKEPIYSIENRIKLKLFGKKFFSEYQEQINNLILNKYSLIYANTIVSLDLAVKIKSSNDIKIILYLLEMNTVIDQLCSNFSNKISAIDSVCFISKFHRKHIENYYNLQFTNYLELIPPIQVYIENNLDNIKKESIVNIVMVGSVHWRKGDDIFIQIARKIISKRNNVHFYWIGPMDFYHEKIIQNDINRLGINDRVKFVGEVENPLSMLKDMDIFILTSREEPFGLAPAEAGMIGLPIIYFKDVTGIGALLEENNLDLSIPYLDIDTMETVLLDLIDNRQKRELLGAKTKLILEKYNEQKFWMEFNETVIDIL